MAVRLGIFVVLVVALIAVSFFGLSILNQSKQQAAVAPAPIEGVLVAADQVSAGSLLQPSDIAAAAVAINAAPQGVIVDSPQNRSDLVGSMMRTTISPGSPILNSMIIHPGDHGFLAAVLAPGMRAVTVGVDDISGSDGLIFPGDYVDVMLTEELPSAPVDHSVAAEEVLSDVRVIATGSEVIKNLPTANSGAAQQQQQTVTLEVTPDQAARCLVATNLGKLSLIVHSASQTQPAAGSTAAAAPLPQPVWSGDVSHALPNPPSAAPTISVVHVFQGTPSGEDYNF